MSELDEIRQLLNLTAQIASSNAKAIESNSAAIAELREMQRQDRMELKASIADVVGMIGTLAQTTEEYRRQAEADRAEIQRIWLYLQGQQRNGDSN